MVGIAQGLVGSLKSAAAATALPAGTMLFFDRPTTGVPIPADWYQLTTWPPSSGDMTKLVVRSGIANQGAGTAAPGTMGIVTLTMGPGAVTNSDGAHTAPGATLVNGPAPSTNPATKFMGPGPVAESVATGAHTHTLTAGTRGPFEIRAPRADLPWPAPEGGPTVYAGQQQGVMLPLIRTDLTTVTKIPAGAIVFSGTSSVFSGFTRKLWPALDGNPASQPQSCGLYTIGRAGEANKMNFYPISYITTPAGGAINVDNLFGATSSSGAHGHGDNTGGRFPGPAPGRTVAVDSGAHVHTDNPSSAYTINYWKQFIHLTPCISTTDQDVQSGMIVMWKDNTVPAGWRYCDGTNGTPDMQSRYIGYNNATPDSTTGVLIGQDQIGWGSFASVHPGTPPSATGFFDTTPGPSVAKTNPSGTRATWFRFVTPTTPSVTWTHGHRATGTWAPTPAPQFPGVAGAAGHGPPSGSPSFHTHIALFPSTQLTYSASTAYEPPHMRLQFIQKI